MEKQSEYDRAAERVKKKIGFYVHLTVYVLVNLLLVTINLVKSPQELWFYWPLVGWGIGMALHAWKVFGNSGTWKFKERMIEQELKQHPQS